MRRAKLFIENMLVYGFGGIVNTMIPFVMLPIITRLMPDTFYLGLNDLVLMIVSFASAFAVVGMSDAMYRMFFEKNDEEFKKSVCSTALMFVGCMAVMVSFILILFRKSVGKFFFEDVQYAYLVYFSAAAVLASAINSIISAPTRMQNQRRIFLVTNTVGPVLSYASAIYLLLQGRYVIALPLAAIISGITMDFSFFFLNRHWFSVRCFDWELLKQLLKLGIPILPAFLIYWIFNSCDRIMIAQFLDVGQVGIYAVGAKLGAVSHLIYTAFAGGWQYFAFSTMKEERQVESNSAVYEYLGAVSFIAGIWMCGLAHPIFVWLFPADYHSGAVVAPYLFLAPLLLMLYQVAGNQFLVIKKSAPITIILFFGALVEFEFGGDKPLCAGFFHKKAGFFRAEREHAFFVARRGDVRVHERQDVHIRVFVRIAAGDRLHVNHLDSRQILKEMPERIRREVNPVLRRNNLGVLPVKRLVYRVRQNAARVLVRLVVGVHSQDGRVSLHADDCNRREIGNRRTRRRGAARDNRRNDERQCQKCYSFHIFSSFLLRKLPHDTTNHREFLRQTISELTESEDTNTRNFHFSEQRRAPPRKPAIAKKSLRIFKKLLRIFKKSLTFSAKVTENFSCRILAAGLWLFACISPASLLVRLKALKFRF